jgi:hypothetical protein
LTTAATGASGVEGFATIGAGPEVNGSDGVIVGILGPAVEAGLLDGFATPRLAGNTAEEFGVVFEAGAALAATTGVAAPAGTVADTVWTGADFTTGAGAGFGFGFGRVGDRYQFASSSFA